MGCGTINMWMISSSIAILKIPSDPKSAVETLSPCLEGAMGWMKLKPHKTGVLLLIGSSLVLEMALQ